MEKDLFDFKKIEDFKLVNISIRDIKQISVESWRVELYNKENDKSIFVIVNVGQLTSILYGLSKVPSIAFSPCIYQLLNNLSKYNNMEIKSVIIDNVEEMLSKTKVEFCDKNNNLIYFDLDSGDAIALASINNIPIYTIKNLLQNLEEENEIEIDLQ